MRNLIHWRYMLIFFLVTGASYAQHTTSDDARITPESLRPMVAQNGVRELALRRAVVEPFSEFRNDLTAVLRELIRIDDPEDTIYGSQRLCIDLAGEYRLADGEILDYLVQNVSKQFPGGRMNVTIPETYPCARALIQIGSPGIGAILKRCHSEPISDIDAECYAVILYHIDGLGLAMHRLRQRLDLRSSTNAQNIRKILDVLDRYD